MYVCMYVCKVSARIPQADLPTLFKCKSGVFEKKPRKTWRLGPQTWRLKKYASNKNNSDRLFVSEYSLPCLVLFVVLFCCFFFFCRAEKILIGVELKTR